jgi:hypothetical protein
VWPLIVAWETFDWNALQQGDFAHNFIHAMNLSFERFGVTAIEPNENRDYYYYGVADSHLPKWAIVCPSWTDIKYRIREGESHLVLELLESLHRAGMMVSNSAIFEIAVVLKF